MPRLNLQPREKKIVAVGIAVLLAVLMYGFARAPLAAYAKKAEAVEKARERLADARSVRDAVATERIGGQAIRQEVASRNAVDLVTFINRHLTEMNLPQSGRASFKRVTTAASTQEFEQLSVDLTGVSMKEIVDFLHRIYSAGNIIVMHTADISPAETGQGLVCHLVLLSPRPSS